MNVIKSTSRFRLTIPKEVRDRLGIRPGQSFRVTEKDGILYYTPISNDPIEYLHNAFVGEPSLSAELLKDRSRDREHE